MPNALNANRDMPKKKNCKKNQNGSDGQDCVWVFFKPKIFIVNVL
jgi:hypothetical protein